MVSPRLFPKKRGKVLPNVGGKVFVIADASSRTGLQAARIAAELGGEVVVLVDGPAHADDILRKLKEAVPNGNFLSEECDLQNFASVRQAIKVITARYRAIYCLANGAGNIPEEGEISADENDATQINMQLSRILLTTELLPLLERHAVEGGDARIVNHSGIGYMLAASRFRENGGVLSGDGMKAMGGGIARYLLPKLDRSALRSPTAFKNKSSRPGTPVLVLSRFVRIKAKGSSRRRSSGSKSLRLVYSGIY